MNRREFGALVPGAALPAAAQSGDSWATLSGTTTASFLQVPPEVSLEERRKQAEICKVRGHVPTIMGNMSGVLVTNTGFVAVPDGPPRLYPNVGAGEWQTCWYCKTRFRFVTTMEEENKP